MSQKPDRPLYVYHDADHGDVEVFTSLEAAKAHADRCWPGQAGEPWDESPDHLFREPYQHIHIRKARSS